MELLRRAARRLLGQTSPLYSLAAATLNNVQVVRREGIGTARSLSRHARSGHARPASFRLRSLAHPIVLPSGPDAYGAILNNVIREEYAAHLPAQWQPRAIVDAGAFVGDTAAYFATRYPHATIVALEPERANFELATQNLTAYAGQVRLLRKGLAGSRRTTTFDGQMLGGALGSGVVPVETIVVSDLLAMFPESRIDLLKMDIEGAELEVVEADAGNWLPRVDTIVAELHGPQITRRVVSALASHGFGARSFRSVTFFRRGWT